jgi:hypothetical protein
MSASAFEIAHFFRPFVVDAAVLDASVVHTV